MRLGGPVFGFDGPGEWVAAHRRAGYQACYFPLDFHADSGEIKAYHQAADEAGLVIAEVGAWSNPISRAAAERRAALERCCRQLALAEEVGARCCVNIAGSRGARWDGPSPDNLTEETFDLIVDTVRQIIDSVRPKRTVYAVETMPWVFPDSPDSYCRLIEAVDRDGFGVHLDPTNFVNCPSRFYRTGDLIRESFEKLGPYIRSCHAKDIALAERLTVHLDEVPIGQGGMDYETYLRELDKLPKETPLMMEHMAEEEYGPAAEHIRSVANRLEIQL